MYASVIWSPFFKSYAEILDRVQHKFLRLAAFKMGRPLSVFDHDYSAVAKATVLCSLGSLRSYTDLILLYKIHSNLIDNMVSVASFNFRAPSRALKPGTGLFSVPFYSDEFQHRLVSARLGSTSNRYPQIDIFSIAISTFKRLCRSAVLDYS